MIDCEIYPLPLSHIDSSDEREEDPQAYADLLRSIAELGLLQPILVVPTEGARYRIVCGRRRWRAFKDLGFETIPALIANADEVAQELAMLSENLHRLELVGAERDAAILRYAQLYDALHPEAGAKALERQEAGMTSAAHRTPEQVAVLEEPREPTPIAAAAQAFGVARETVRKAITRAQTFSGAQRQVLEDAKVTGAEMDLLAKEEPTVIQQVVNLIAADYRYDEAMSEVMRDQGRAYLGAETTLDDVESRLAKLVVRRQVQDPEALDNDAKLFWAIERELKRFKKKIDWIYKKEMAGKNPHGLYYRRLELLLETSPPRLWQPCKCQKNGEPQFNCAYCRGGAYQIA